MHDAKQEAQEDARRLLVAFSTNHAEARMVSPHGPDRPFTPNWADAEQAGLDRARRDSAMGWLVHNDMLESEEEEAEEVLDTGEGFHSEYGSCSGSPTRGGSCWKRPGNEDRNKRGLRDSHIGGLGGVGC